jgi:hypothetical protein
MRLTTFLSASLLIALILTPGEAHSVPRQIAFQGFLMDETTGRPFEGTADLILALYDAETDGNRVWPDPPLDPERHNNVLVSEGVFQIALGSLKPLDPADFDGSPLWLGVAVEDQDELPRTQLRTSPFAMRAAVADSAGVVGMPDDGDWARNDGDIYRLTGNVGIGLTNPSSKLHVDGTAEMTGFTLPTGAADGSVLTSNASGVGTWQPLGGGLQARGGSFQAPSSPGNHQETGLGFQPTALLFWVASAWPNGGTATGFMTNTEQMSQNNGSDNANHASSFSTQDITVRDGNGGPTRLKFDLVSLDPDGFTVNFSTANSGYTVMYLGLH